MPQLILIALAGAGLVLGYRWYLRESKRVARVLAEAEAVLARRGKGGTATLERDPETGIYRPRGGGEAR